MIGRNKAVASKNVVRILPWSDRSTCIEHDQTFQPRKRFRGLFQWPEGDE